VLLKKETTRQIQRAAEDRRRGSGFNGAPVVETAAALQGRAAARVAVPAAVCGPAIVAEIALRVPLLLALAVGRCCRRNLHGGVHVIKAVRNGAGRAPSVELAVVVEASQVPVCGEDTQTQPAPSSVMFSARINRLSREEGKLCAREL
jgi:hypothetical protein